MYLIRVTTRMLLLLRKPVLVRPRLDETRVRRGLLPPRRPTLPQPVTPVHMSLLPHHRPLLTHPLLARSGPHHQPTKYPFLQLLPPMHHGTTNRTWRMQYEGPTYRLKLAKQPLQLHEQPLPWLPWASIPRKPLMGSQRRNVRGPKVPKHHDVHVIDVKPTLIGVLLGSFDADSLLYDLRSGKLVTATVVHGALRSCFAMLAVGMDPSLNRILLHSDVSKA